MRTGMSCQAQIIIQTHEEVLSFIGGIIGLMLSVPIPFFYNLAYQNAHRDHRNRRSCAVVCEYRLDGIQQPRLPG